MNPVDFKLTVLVSPGDTYEWSKVLLARANFDGNFEVLTAAWERLLGYGRYEFARKTLCQLMGSNSTAAAVAVAAILDESSTEPVDLTLRCRRGVAKPLRLHRRLDEYEHRMFIVAEERQAEANQCFSGTLKYRPKAANRL